MPTQRSARLSLTPPPERPDAVLVAVARGNDVLQQAGADVQGHAAGLHARHSLLQHEAGDVTHLGAAQLLENDL